MLDFYKNRRFLYGIIIFVISSIGLFSVVGSIDDAEQKWQKLQNDTRFEKKNWENATVIEREKLADEKMAAKIQLGQIKYGKAIFIFGTALGAILLCLAFIPMKSKMDKLIDQMESDEQ